MCALAILAKSVRVGDVIKEFAQANPQLVREIEHIPATERSPLGEMDIFLNQYGWRRLDAGRPVILVHRPWLYDETDSSMRSRIQNALRNVARVGTLPAGKTFDLTIHQCLVELDPFRDDRALRELREAIEAYELGKPVANQQQKEGE